ncbi:MAG: bifunctional pyr operon transcriptional regulator/uracil phosphoribosyltransferase PyrR [Candidatus Omnitrophica bacterium]|nr:bifunctional pyr operon transcriptional regulator/uracil phosphoribosyltransferase PyrR [Candidatus Omnitrophota bacterium]
MAKKIADKTKILDSKQVHKTIRRISHEIIERNKSLSDIVIAGIRTRGVYLADRIAKDILDIEGVDIPCGALDITLYRDDLTLISEQPQVKETELNLDINDKLIIIVDDVLFTGRTIRCAMDALIDFGRPRAIQLAVLVDRGHRELPIRADYVGKNIPTSTKESVEVRLKEVDGKDEVVVVEVLDD